MLVLDNISTLVTVTGQNARPDAPHPVLQGKEMGDIGVRHNAAVAIRNDKIEWIGDAGGYSGTIVEQINCHGKTVLPGFVDAHTHLVFTGNRSGEFAMRLRGASYQEIAEAGGGILSSMKSVRNATVEEIIRSSRPLVRNAFRHGSTTIEVKSGYGLDTDSELRLLEAIQVLDREEPPTLIPTFLGAHAMPPEHKENRERYISEIIEKMIPEVAARNLAEYCDVFTDTGYFTVEESERIFAAGKEHGLKPRVHADELSSFGAAEMSARIKALSADHLLMISDEGIEQMRDADVVALLLPGTAFFLGLPYAPARKMIERGMAVAVATDCNPGSNMSENMQMTLALSCMGMKMTVEEAITASTLNAAASLERSRTIGSVETGKIADLTIFNVPDYPDIVYHYGINQVQTVIKNGIVHYIQ